MTRLPDIEVHVPGMVGRQEVVRQFQWKTQRFPLAAPGELFVSLAELSRLLDQMRECAVEDMGDRGMFDPLPGVLWVKEVVDQTRAVNGC